MKLVVACLILFAGTAHAIGNGSITATPAVSLVTTANGTGTTNATLQNTTAGAITVELVKDASCDADLDFSVGGGSPFTLGGGATKPVTFNCTNARIGMERCVVHARDATTHESLADVAAVCDHVTGTQLTTSMPALGFGSLAIGDSTSLSLGITNTGSMPISRLFFQTDELADNFEVGLPCNPDGAACDGSIAALAPGATKTITVRCSPTSVGIHTAHLEVASDLGSHLASRVTLTCTGTAAAGPVLGVTPQVGVVAVPVEVTSGTAHTSVYFSNLGTGTLVISDVRLVDVDPGAASDWSLTVSGTCAVVNCSLGPGQAITADIAFDPSQIATRRAFILVTYKDTISRTRAVTLDGTGTGATLSLFGTPNAIDFGVVPIGRSSMLPLHFTNGGNRDTQATVAIAPAGPFTLNPPSMLTVTPTAVADLTVTCAPSASGTSPAMIVTTDTDTLATTTISVGAACTGSSGPLFAEPSAVALGEVRMNGGASVTTVMVQSTGAPLTLVAPHLESANANISLGALSATTTPATFDITVTPTTQGDLANHVIVTDSAGDTIEIPVTGKIVVADYTTPATKDLGTFCVGRPTGSSNVTLDVTGTATLGVMTPTVPPTSGFDLRFVAPTLFPVLLAPDRTATVGITPQPQGMALDLSTTLTWTTDVAIMPVETTVVTARFVDKGGAISPRGLDFGSKLVHLYVPDGQRVTLQNCNSSTLELDPPTIKAPFSIDSPSFPTSLEPNEQATFSVGFHPTRIGSFDEVLSISSPQLPGVPLTVSLHGTSTTDTVTPTDAGIDDVPGSTTFYACSCKTSSPGGAAPILVAFAWLVIGRRRSGSS